MPVSRSCLPVDGNPQLMFDVIGVVCAVVMPFCAVSEFGGRVAPRLARYLFFASPKKSTQKKGDPAVCDPFGANLRRGVCGVLRGTRYALARCARKPRRVR